MLTTDPFVTTDPDLLPFDEVIARSDLLILCTPHRAYKTADLKDKPWSTSGDCCKTRMSSL